MLWVFWDGCWAGHHSRGGSLSLNQLYKEPAPTFKTTVWYLISARMIWVHAQGSASYLSLYFPAGRIDQEPHHLTCKLSIYSTSYSERTAPFCQVVTNVISKNNQLRKAAATTSNLQTHRKHFWRGALCTAFVMRKERSYHWCKLPVMGGFSTYAS